MRRDKNSERREVGNKKAILAARIEMAVERVEMREGISGIEP